MTKKPDYLPSARPRSEEELEADRQLAQKTAQQVKSALNQGRAALWVLAGSLYEFHERKAWEALGYERLTEWLAEPEVGLTYMVYKRLVRVYRELAVLRGVELNQLLTLDYTKADVVLPALKSGEVLQEEALADVQTLGWRDLREKYQKPKQEDEAEAEDEGAAQPTVTGEVVDEQTELPPPDLDVEDALEAWHALLHELQGAAASGTAQPRVAAQMIEDGLRGLQRALRAAVDAELILESDV